MNSKLFISTASQLDAAEICYLQWGNIICHEWLPKPINKMFSPLQISPIHVSNDLHEGWNTIVPYKRGIILK